MDSIKDLSRIGAVRGLDVKTRTSKKGSSGSCVKGKHTKESLRTNNSRSGDRCAVVHTDVCGPMSVPSLPGARYFVSFIDELLDTFRFIPIVRKGNVLKHFIKYDVWL